MEEDIVITIMILVLITHNHKVLHTHSTHTHLELVPLDLLVMDQVMDLVTMRDLVLIANTINMDLIQPQDTTPHLHIMMDHNMHVLPLVDLVKEDLVTMVVNIKVLHKHTTPNLYPPIQEEEVPMDMDPAMLQVPMVICTQL